MAISEVFKKTQSGRLRKRLDSTAVKTKDESNVSVQIEQAITTIFFCIIGGCLFSILYSFQAAKPADFFAGAGVAIAIAGASLLTGGLLGFLFAIPRWLQHTSANTSSQTSDGANQNSGNRLAYQPNTNLEEISDWLTKILVGVGLTQLTKLPGYLQDYANFTAAGLNFGSNVSNTKVFAVALLIHFLICGFLITYLWTRLYLPKAFQLQQADIDAIVENKVNELAKNDATALDIVQRQLHPQPTSQPISQEQLDTAIKLASLTVKEQIYHQASTILDESPTDPSKMTRLESTIPIFKALIASDKEIYWYHGDLGYVLQMQRQPKAADAEAEFTRAIELRGDWKRLDPDHTEVYLEFYRAQCRIMQDDNFKQEKESTPEFQAKIWADIEAANSDPEHKRWVSENKLISDWLQRNPSKHA